MELEAYQSCFNWGFIKKKQKYRTLSKDFLGCFVTPQGEYVKKYNKCFAFFVLLEKKQNGRLRREFDKHVSLFRKLPSKKY
jgi:hypothetical protein